ncbi:MAG: hypothetical protein WCH61_03930, partial [bacterium]
MRSHSKVLSLLALLAVSWPAWPHEPDRECVSGGFSNNGKLTVGVASGEIISGDRLMVLEGNQCVYYIPEAEAPPFATLLYPTGGDKPRQNHLELAHEGKSFTCEGRRSGMVKFLKRLELTGDGFKLDLEYKLEGDGQSLEYVLTIPADHGERLGADTFEFRTGGGVCIFKLTSDGLASSLEKGREQTLAVVYLKLKGQGTAAGKVQLIVSRPSPAEPRSGGGEPKGREKP